LLLPFLRRPVSAADRRRLHALDRDLWWNPQRHVDGSAPKARELSDEKTRWIHRPTISPGERRERFGTLRKLTQELRPFVHDEEEQTRARLEQTAHDLRIEQIRSRRDYAFCLYPEDALKAFCTQFL
jgi:hypothetical protein